MAKSGSSRQKKLRFCTFPEVQVLIHTRKHLGKGFRKFSAKTYKMKRNEVIDHRLPKYAKVANSGKIWGIVKNLEFEFSS